MTMGEETPTTFAYNICVSFKQLFLVIKVALKVDTGHSI